MPSRNSAHVVARDCPMHELLTLKQIHPVQGLLTSIVSVLTADSSGTKSMRLSRSSSCVGTQFDFSTQILVCKNVKGCTLQKGASSAAFACKDMQQLCTAVKCDVESESHHGLQSGQLR